MKRSNLLENYTQLSVNFTTKIILVAKYGGSHTNTTGLLINEPNRSKRSASKATRQGKL